MNIIGILGAMPDEIALLDSKLADKREEKIGGCTFYLGTMHGKSIVLCCAGMGKVNSAAATQLLITHFGAEAVVFIGIAGSMTGKIGIGDVVISDTVVYHDAENRMIAEAYPHMQSFKADGALIRAAETACADAKVNYIVGKIATGDKFIGDAETKNAIAAACAPDCVEMEGAAVAHVAAKNDTPFVILRAMSDLADESAYDTLVVKQFDIKEYCHTAATICADMIEQINSR